MANRVKKNLIILSTILITLPIFSMPIGIVHAEETEPQEVMDEIEPTESIRISLAESTIQGVLNEEYLISFETNIETNQISLVVPEEVVIVEKALTDDLSVTNESGNSWQLDSQTLKREWKLPVIANEAGEFTIIIEGEDLILNMSRPEGEMENKVQPPRVEIESDSSDETTGPALPSDDLVGLEKVMVYDSDGNLISGNDDFSIDDIFHPRVNGNTTVANNSLIRNVGYYNGRAVNLRLSGNTRSLRIESGSVSYSLNWLTPNFEQHVGYTAVYADTDTPIEATKLYISLGISANLLTARYAPIDSTFRVIQRNVSTISIVQNWFNPALNTAADVIIDNGSILRQFKDNSHTSTGTGSGTILTNTSPFMQGRLRTNHINLQDDSLIKTELVSGNYGVNFSLNPLDDPRYELVSTEDSTTGFFTLGEQTITLFYRFTEVSPADPLNPDVEIDPENKPELPENNGLLSIDFASQFSFGKQMITLNDQTYSAKPQRLLNSDGTVNSEEERPNYIQISDRRSENDRNGWELTVRQEKQFSGEDGQELSGAQIRLTNQEMISVHGGQAPSLHASNPLPLTPGNTRTLMRATGNEGTGTWIYRFGNAQTAGESVQLHVPQGAPQDVTHYSTSLTWELIAVPTN